MKPTILMLGLLLSAPVVAQEVADCDLQAAHPSDPDHVGPGISSADVDTEAAISACRLAVAEHPGQARFHYQLGRALTYHADRSGGDAAEGFDYVKRAAEMNHTQSLFVLGLLHLRAGDVCAAEPVTKQAADQGLKSARITYVNAVLAGNYGECGVSASLVEMAAYLDGASSQVRGYYENMLLADLKRRLAILVPLGDEE
jgi:TPR repeat protein